MVQLIKFLPKKKIGLPYPKNSSIPKYVVCLTVFTHLIRITQEIEL